MEIVLVEPEIPQNTGNIARTCALTRTRLHLIKPLGFSIEDRYLKRAGLDYWQHVDIKVWNCFEDLVASCENRRFILATTKAKASYHEMHYREDDMIVFGKETRGLPQGILDCYPETQVRVPMLDIGRSLNLSNSVAIIVYEGLRQCGFPSLI